ncbi:YggT family protein [Indiicoccus explosivorum]|uniref:YggT family protein n=1 Tax=Indiicoccus explosivorum TaxID=1917864 RepID=UPI000B44AFF9|nr:YggT family protein [Indiicoccus explosivorum]
MYEVVRLLTLAIDIYSFILIIYIFMSWIPSTRETGIGQMIGRISEPYLEIFRKIIPPFGMIDFSPIVAIFALRLASRGLWTLFIYTL